MGLFTSKIAVGLLAGGFTLAGAGLLFTGGAALDNATAFVQDAGNRIIQFGANEDAYKGKIASLQENANSKIQSANEAILDLRTQREVLEGQVGDLETEIEGLNDQISTLEGEIATLTADLSNERADHGVTRALLATKTTEYNNKVVQLAAKQAEVEGLKFANKVLVETVAQLTNQAVRADAVVKELEDEMIEANAAVEAHGVVVEEVQAATEGVVPSTQEEIDAIDVTLDEVDVE